MQITFNKEKEWNVFSMDVRQHISSYVVPQYGDSPNDPASQYTAEQLKTQLEKYIKRAGKNSRGPTENKRDCLKIAHYAQMLYDRMEEKETQES